MVLGGKLLIKGFSHDRKITLRIKVLTKYVLIHRNKAQGNSFTAQFTEVEHA